VAKISAYFCVFYGIPSIFNGRVQWQIFIMGGSFRHGLLKCEFIPLVEHEGNVITLLAVLSLGFWVRVQHVDIQIFFQLVDAKELQSI